MCSSVRIEMRQRLRDGPGQSRGPRDREKKHVPPLPKTSMIFNLHLIRSQEPLNPFLLYRCEEGGRNRMHPNNSSQVSQVIFDLLGCELPETRPSRTLDAFDTQKMVRRGSNNTWAKLAITTFLSVGFPPTYRSQWYLHSSPLRWSPSESGARYGRHPRAPAPRCTSSPGKS